MLAGFARRAKKLDEAKSHYLAALACPVRDPLRLPYVYLYLATIAKDRGDAAGLVTAIRGLESTDASLPTPSGAMEFARNSGLIH